MKKCTYCNLPKKKWNFHFKSILIEYHNNYIHIGCLIKAITDSKIPNQNHYNKEIYFTNPVVKKVKAGCTLKAIKDIDLFPFGTFCVKDHFYIVTKITDYGFTIVDELNSIKTFPWCFITNFLIKAPDPLRINIVFSKVNDDRVIDSVFSDQDDAIKRSNLIGEHSLGIYSLFANITY